MNEDAHHESWSPDRGVEIRLLGTWEVRRSDGSTVAPREWRTGKTADLVRMLAVANGQPTPTEVLVAVLWPGSEPRRGQSSLRTAASLVRQIIGHQHLERTPRGLRLNEVWVDIAAFRTLAADVQRAASRGDRAAVQGAAHQADFLYQGDIRAHDDSAGWVDAERRSLSASYQALLCTAGEAALAGANGQDAV